MTQSHTHEKKPKVSSVFTDRIAADGEQVAQVLEPNRSADNVRYPDPHSPGSVDDGLSATPDSNADFQMARRTDAGPSEAAERMPGKTKTYSVWLWIIGGGILLLIAALAINM